MKPTHEMLNRAAAEALGWTGFQHAPYWEERQPIAILLAIPPGDECGELARCPDYCTDRNALPELWAKVREAGTYGYTKYRSELWMQLPVSKSESHLPFMMITAEPRLHVIAALKALDKWPAEWED